METLGTFHIAEPCHENWNKMTTEVQGRFCASCQRCVVDFTQKTQTEMKAIYDREAGNVCGRVRISQVAKPKTAIRATVDRFKMRSLKAIQMFALALLASFSLVFHAETQAQNAPMMGKIAYVPERVGEGDLTGRVVETDGTPIKNADVWIRQDGNEVATAKTDAKGMYRFRKLQSGDYEITASSAEGYASTLMHHAGQSEQAADLVVEEERMMGGMMFIPDEIDTIVPVKRIMPEITPELTPIAPIDPIELIHEVFPLIDPVQPIGTDPDSELEASKLLTDAPIDLAGYSIRVFPNPTTDRVTLLLDRAGEEQLALKLYDIDGKEVYGGTWLPALQPTHTIEMQSLPSGIYILRVEAGNQAINRQILKI